MEDFFKKIKSKYVLKSQIEEKFDTLVKQLESEFVNKINAKKEF